MLKKTDLVLRFLSYYIKGQNRHDLHSPFIYNLNENVFRHDVIEDIHDKIELRRKELLADDSIIQVKDFGAGFSGIKYHNRKISFITRNSSKPAKYARLLFRLVKYFRPQVMLELGTSVGISALYQSAGNPAGKFITVEGCPQTASVAAKSFSLFGNLNIHQVILPFDEALPEIINDNPKPDYVFIDGHHTKEATLKYFEQLLPSLHKHSIIVVDDINWSDDMREAWKILCNHSSVTASVNLFMMGILFIDPALSREEFIIRY